MDEPVHAEDREHHRKLLKVASGGVVFATIQKFAPDEKGERMPLLSDRRNIVVIADEAQRSQQADAGSDQRAAQRYHEQGGAVSQRVAGWQ